MKFWLYLPDYNYAPEPEFLIADFIQLLLAVCQMFVFSIEFGSDGEIYEGGDNREIAYNRILPEEPPPVNPVKDFIIEGRLVIL